MRYFKQSVHVCVFTFSIHIINLARIRGSHICRSRSEVYAFYKSVVR